MRSRILPLLAQHERVTRLARRLWSLLMPPWLFHGPMWLRRLSAWWLPYYGYVAYSIEERLERKRRSE